MTTKAVRTGLLLGFAIALAVPVTMLLPVHLIPSAHAPSPYLVGVQGGEYDYLPMMNWCGKGDYGKFNVLIPIKKLMYDGITNYDWYFYEVTLETVPGNIACGSSWMTDNTYTTHIVQSPDQLVSHSPTSTQGASTYTVSLGANAGSDGVSASFQTQYSYSIADVIVNDESDTSANRAQWLHDITEQSNGPTSTATYDAIPGYVVRTPENSQSLVNSVPDSNSPCNDSSHGCSFRVDWGQQGPWWCGGWSCANYAYTWVTSPLYFDALMTGDSPNSPVINNVPNLSTNEGQQVSYPITGSDQDGDPVTYTLGSAPAGASITNQGLFTWTPPDNSEGTYWVQVVASDGYGGTASQWFYVNVNEADNAQFISMTAPPATMNPGSQATISVTMKNTGSSTWLPASSNPPNPFRLGAQNPQDNTNWGFNRVQLTQPVSPGSQYTFTFVITAPSTPGTYNVQYRMVEEWIEWFGDYSPSYAVTVPGISLSSCGSISMLTGGSSGSCSITVTSVGGVSGTVNLSLSGGGSGGPSATLSPPSVSLPSGGTASATVSLVSGGTNGNFYFTVTGSIGAYTASTTFRVYQYTSCGCGGGGGSIADGSLITMADGSTVPVQNLKVGDQMLGYDTTTGQYTISVIKSFTVVDTTNMLIIHTAAGIPFRVDANPHQTLWVKSASGAIGWKPVTQIQVGDDLFTQNGWTPVTGIDFAPAGTHIMYDIIASTPYFADGYLDPIYKV